MTKLGDIEAKAKAATPVTGHRDYSLADECEPSKYCNACAHDVVEELESELTAALERATKAERENEAWQAFLANAEGEAVTVQDAAIDLAEKLGLMGKDPT